jgi:hypothetical protein
MVKNAHSFSADFELVKETKGAYQFRELDANDELIKEIRDSKIGILYVRKTSFTKASPTKLKVTVECVE